MKKIFLPILSILVITGCAKQLPAVISTGTTSSTTNTGSTTTTTPIIASLQIASPLDRIRERVTKKFYGTYVTPKASPVSPEKFTGYHTGVDFETFPEEQKNDVPVRAICTGPLVLKKQATGYGGVAVQKCSIDNQTVAVTYGHLRLASITADIDTNIEIKSILGVLGTGYSTETDGERKHLHLSIHKGNEINIKGYVQNKNELGAWIDPSSVLQ